MRSLTLLSIASTLLFVLAGAPAHADAMLSPDITVDLGGTVVFDDEVVEEVGGTASLVSIGVPGDLPESTDVNGFDLYAGDVYFTTDTTIELPGGITATPAMVVSETGGTYTIEFDGSVLPPGVTVDAVFALSSGDLVMSFDTTASVSGTTLADEDLARWDGSTMSMYVDMSTHGVPSAMDLDGAVPGPGSIVLVSFDVSGSLGGLSFDDEDILSLDTGTSTWAMSFDGSAAYASLAPVDVVAVPEPGLLAGLLVGGLFTAALARRRASPPA